MFPFRLTASFLCFFAYSRQNVDISDCTISPFSSTAIFLKIGEPLILEQITPLTRGNINCNFNVSVPKYSRPVALFQGSLGEVTDDVNLYQNNPYLNLNKLITTRVDQNVTILLHPFDFFIRFNLLSNKTMGRFTLTLTAISIWQEPQEEVLDEELGTILDSNELQPLSARRYSCGLVPDCVPCIHGAPLLDDFYEQLIIDDDYRSFLDNYYVFADDVFVFDLRSGYTSLVNQIGYAFNNSTTLLIIHDQDIVNDDFTQNVILLISSNENAFPPDYAGTRIDTTLQNAVDFGNINLNGGRGTIFHMVLPQDHNPFLTSFIIDFVPLEKHGHFELLNVYANCASRHNDESLLASITEDTAEKWRYLMLRGRCRTFFLSGQVQLQLAAQYQSAFAEVSSVRNGFLISDEYLSQNNVLVNDSVSLTFTNGSTGTVSMYWTQTGQEDQVIVSVDGDAQTLEANRSVNRSGKHFLITYELGENTKGAIVHFQAESNCIYMQFHLLTSLLAIAIAS